MSASSPRPPTRCSRDGNAVRSTWFEIPDDVADVAGFHRWLFSRLLDAERHEAAEFYRVAGQAPFWPNHQDEGSPYEPVERDIAWH
jgi:hypothetical protein